ncbi:MAG TPA: PEGA domain-containing protein, partial [Polyangiaceae bacterium LLY-WYZ-15_(1-7)]|nr:PEGA domain-containing protein [Polyangiaceae bacterium LLY-WYZ-15_(1-7)]
WPAEEPEASGSASPPETAAPPSGEERATERGPRVEPLVLPDGPDEAVTEAGGSTEAGGNTEEASGADEEGLAEDGGSAGDEELAEEALAEEGPERDRDEAAAAPEARTETGEEAPIPEGEAALLVQTQPAGARVLLDGEPLVGRTPHRFEDLPAGRHQVTVLLPGHRPVRRWVRLRDGRGGLLRFRLRRR